MDATGAFIDLEVLHEPLRVVGATSPLSRLALEPAVAVAGSCPLVEAIATMRRAGVSALLVDDPVGLITHRDLARGLVDGQGPTDRVEAVSTGPPITVPGATTVVAAAALMLNEHVRHLVVVLDPDDHRVVSMRDLLAVLLQTVDPNLWLTSLRVALDPPSEIWVG